MSADYSIIREAFFVRRYHTVGHVHKEETLGHHTANVVAIVFYLYDDMPPLYMVRHALHHDVPEVVTGDSPATAKWKHPEIAKALEAVEEKIIKAHGLENQKLTDLESAVLKYADMMDLCFKAVEELATGNDSFTPVLFNGLVYIRSLLAGPLSHHQKSHELYGMLRGNSFINVESVYNGQDLVPSESKH